MARLAACEMQLQDLLQGWVVKGLPSAVVMLQTSGRDDVRSWCERRETGAGSTAARIAAVEAVEAIEKLELESYCPLGPKK